LAKEKKIKKEKISEKENKWFNNVLIFAFFVFLAIFTTFKITGDDDLFWHLATGRYIINTGTVPSTDVFGYMTQGQQWMPFEWGWDVITYGVYNLAGYTGLSILRTFLLFITFGIIFYTLKKFKVSDLFIIISLIIFSFAIIDRLTPRPHLMSYIFFVSLIYIICSYRYFNRNNYKILYFIPLIFLLWANLHMGIIAGGFLMFVYFISEFINTFYSNKFIRSEIRPLTKPELMRLFLIMLASALVMLVNPNFLQTYIYAYDHTKMKLLETVNEWLSPFSNRFGDGILNNLYKILLFAGVINIFYSIKKKDVFPALLYIAFAIYSVRAMRFTVDYIIITFVFIIVSANTFFNLIKSEKTRFNITGKPLLKILVTILLVWMTINLPNDKLYLEQLKYYRVTGFGINSDFIPTAMFDFMKANKITERGERIFNHFGTGGFFIWNFEGKQNFIDSRNLNDDIFFKYQQIISKQSGFERKLDEYKIDYAIYLAPDLVRDPKEMENTVISYFCKSSNWKLLFWDDKSFLWVRNDEKFRDLIDKYEYRYLSPYSYAYQRGIIDKGIGEDFAKVKSELERVQGENPKGIVLNSILQVYGNKIK